VQNRARKADAGILRPAAALEEIGVGDEKEYEQAQVMAGHGIVRLCCAHGHPSLLRMRGLYVADSRKSTGAARCRMPRGTSKKSYREEKSDLATIPHSS